LLLYLELLEVKWSLQWSSELFGKLSLCLDNLY